MKKHLKPMLFLLAILGIIVALRLNCEAEQTRRKQAVKEALREMQESGELP